MENNSRYLEACGAGERSGLYYTCINSYLTVDELAYIVQNCEAQVLITSAEKLDVARRALARCPRVRPRSRPGILPVRERIDASMNMSSVHPAPCCA